jgi:hypothetical protein
MPADKQFNREMFIGMLAYVVLLFGSIFWIKAHLQSPVRFAVTLLPMIPLIYLARASVGRLTRLDEMQRQVQLGALGVTVLATALLTLTYGFLENVGAPQLSLIWIWPIMGAVWGISSCIAARYYS